jgi:hypothetical protein
MTTKPSELLGKVPMPKRIAELPRDPERGYPIPFFVSIIDGKADFRVVDGPKVLVCIRQRRCWICGQPLGRYLAFVIGPMCAVNGISAEPPMHRDCALYSVAVCPFLLNPNQKRNYKKYPDGYEEPGGIMLEHNPGVMLLWITTGFSILHDPKGKFVLRLGDPVHHYWYSEGDTASRAQVLDAFEKGLARLRELAAEDGPDALKALEGQIIAAVKLLPLE